MVTYCHYCQHARSDLMGITHPRQSAPTGLSNIMRGRASQPHVPVATRTVCYKTTVATHRRLHAALQDACSPQGEDKANSIFAKAVGRMSPSGMLGQSLSVPELHAPDLVIHWQQDGSVCSLAAAKYQWAEDVLSDRCSLFYRTRVQWRWFAGLQVPAGMSNGLLQPA